MDGDPEANFAHFCLQKFGWEPSKFMNLPVKERAFVIASIKTRIEAEKKKEAELKSKGPQEGKTVTVWKYAFTERPKSWPLLCRGYGQELYLWRSGLRKWPKSMISSIRQMLESRTATLHLLND